MTERERYIKGLLIAFTGVAVLSFDALLIRLSGVSGFVAVFYRALFTAISMGILFFSLERKKSLTHLKEGGRPMILSGMMWGISGGSFTLGVQMAGVANTLVLISLSPLFAAAFARIVYKVRIQRSTIIAAVFAIGGVWFIYRKGFGELDLTGLFFALLTPIFLGSNLSFMRNHEHVRRMPIVMIGGITGTIISFLVTKGDVAISASALLPLALLGFLAIPFAQTTISTGVKYIHAPEAALINSCETVLGVVYVWLFLGEVPASDMITGGLIVFAAISINSVYQATKSGR